MKTTINIEIPNLRTYKLMYKYGAWVTKEVLACESDYEAIFDADMTFNSSNLKNWTNGVALFQGNRMVKRYI